MKFLEKRFYPNIDKNNLLFDNRALKALLLPLVLEQFLNCLMGMIDTMMVGNVGSAAISAVSLADSINFLVIQVFAAMSTGATIICSQYLGSKQIKECNNAARQVVFTVFVSSVLLTILGLIFHTPLLHAVFGQVEADVMTNSQTYFLITVLSYPFLALFTAASAFFRAGGNSRFPMIISVISNVINVFGNAVLIFVFHMGVAGAAISTLISRIFNAVVLLYYLRKPNQPIVLKDYFSIRPNKKLISSILAVGVPSGIENGMFQFGKLAIQSTVSTMGTAAIAAQAMTGILEAISGVFGMGVGIGLMTIVGQSIGAGKPEEAKYYIIKLTKIAEVGILISCLLTFLITKPVTILGGLTAESAAICFRMMILITIFKPLFWVLSFVPAYGMRAAGDVRFSMFTAIITMWLARVALCIFLVKTFHMGLTAVWIGMFADWGIRAVIFSWRFFSGKWLKDKLI